jgi:hypothetical protein
MDFIELRLTASIFLPDKNAAQTFGGDGKSIFFFFVLYFVYNKRNSL